MKLGVLAPGRDAIMGHRISVEGPDLAAEPAVATGALAYGDVAVGLQIANTTRLNAQDLTAVAALTGGGFVVVWRDGSAGITQQTIRAQRFDGGGAAAGTEFIINAPASTSTPSITGTPGGGFIVAWSETSKGALLRAYDAGGQPTGGEVTVQNGAGTESSISVAALANGNFMVVWQVTGAPVNGGTPRDIYGKVYAADGSVLTPDFILSSGTANNQVSPRVVAVGDGFAVTWSDDRPVAGQDFGQEILGQRFSGTGAFIGGEFHVSPSTTGAQFSPVITALSDGGFVVAWSNTSMAETISAQRYAADGTAVGPVIDLSRTLYAANPDFIGTMRSASIAADTQGGFVVSWVASTFLYNSLYYEVVSQQVDASGALLGDFVPITNFETDVRSGTALALLASGQIVGAWADASLQSGQSGTDIAYEIFNVYQRITGGDGDDTLSNTSGRIAAIDGKGGDDTITGMGGDQIDGGPGNDRITATGSDATVDGGDGDDVITANSAIVYGSAGNDRIAMTGGGYADGGDGDDLITLTGVIDGASIQTGGGSNQVTIDVTTTGVIFLDTLAGGVTTASIRAVGSGAAASYDTLVSVSAQLGDSIYVHGARVQFSDAFGAGQQSVTIDPNAINKLNFFSFYGGEAGSRLDLSAYGADPFGSGRLTLQIFSGGSGAVLITDTVTGSTYNLGNVNVANLSIYNLGVSTGRYAPVGLTINDAFSTSPTTDWAGTLIGADADDTIRGYGGDDTLFGGGGNDLLDGGIGSDRLYGGSGADQMIGGAGDDSYYVDVAGDQVIENAGEGSDTVVTAIANYLLPANVENLVYTGSAATTLIGSAADNRLTGGSGSDTFNLSQGGNDTALGGAGDDGFYFGVALTAADVVDGGAGGFDQLALQGNYAGLTLGAATVTGIENVVLLSGSDTRFGDTANNRYSYAITTRDANVAAGQVLAFSANQLLAGENFTLDAAAETDGIITTYGGAGADLITGGQQSDGFFFGNGLFGANDRVDGQGGTLDQLAIQGNYTGGSAIAFGASQIVSIENLVLLSASDLRFGNGGTTYSYDITLNDASVTTGPFAISANTLTATETLRLNAAAESGAAITVYSGAGDDLIVMGAGADRVFGGAGADRIVGNGGADQLTGGAGADTFAYLAVSDSTAAARDRILDFAMGDKIDLGAVGGLTFVSGAFTGANQLHVVDQGDGTYLVEAEANGDGNADLIILVTSDHVLTAADFVGVSGAAGIGFGHGGGGADLLVDIVGRDPVWSPFGDAHLSVAPVLVPDFLI